MSKNFRPSDSFVLDLPWGRVVLDRARAFIPDEQTSFMPRHDTFSLLVRRGKFQAETKLDLHGYTTLEAEETLTTHFLSMRKRKLRSTCIITGRGTGVLRTHVMRYLARREDVVQREVDPRRNCVYAILTRKTT